MNLQIHTYLDYKNIDYNILGKKWNFCNNCYKKLDFNNLTFQNVLICCYIWHPILSTFLKKHEIREKKFWGYQTIRDSGVWKLDEIKFARWHLVKHFNQQERPVLIFIDWNPIKEYLKIDSNYWGWEKLILTIEADKNWF